MPACTAILVAAACMHVSPRLSFVPDGLIAAEDAELKDRIKVTLNRAKPGTPEVDERMDASPVFGNIDRYTYGENGVQVFVETDHIAGGPLGDNWVFEFDYVFPGYKNNILNAPSDDAIAILEAKEAAEAG